MNFFYRWLPQALIISVLCLLVYAGIQQDYRQSLNDPQIAMAEDAAALLSSGKAPEQLVPAQTVDIGASLTPWLAVYDAQGNPIASSGMLDGALPNLPPGIFDTAGWSSPIIGHHLNTQPPNENRFSWQPRPTVRQATVLVQASNGMFVAAGRSMREVENREQAFSSEVAVSWAFLMLATFLWEFFWSKRFL